MNTSAIVNEYRNTSVFRFQEQYYLGADANIFTERLREIGNQNEGYKIICVRQRLSDIDALFFDI